VPEPEIVRRIQCSIIAAAAHRNHVRRKLKSNTAAELHRAAV
jgi:hypothetical protein